MIAPINTKQDKKLTQKGLNLILWEIIRIHGGIYNIKHGYLESLPKDAAIRIDYDSSSDNFVLRTIRVETSSIIGGNIKIIE